MKSPAMALLAVILLLFLGGTVSAQLTKVVPGACATTEGPTSISRPFYNEMIRCQMLYRVGALGKAGGLLMGVDFRRDGMYSLAFTSCVRDVQIDLYVTPVLPSGMTTTFASNRGTGKTTTLFNAKVNLPALPIPTTTPAPWAIKFKFIQPQPYVNAAGNLLFEFILKGPGTGYNRYYLDGDYVSKNAGGKSSMLGMYCVGKGNEVFKCDPITSTWVLGGNAEMQWGPGGNVPTSILAFIGHRSNQWGPIKLPFDLAPIGGTSTSKDPCMLYTNYLMGQVIQVNQKATFGPIPNLPVLENVMLYTQGLAAIPSANALGITTGPAFSITIGSNTPPVADINMMYQYNNNSATTGRLYSTGGYYGPVTQFSGSFN